MLHEVLSHRDSQWRVGETKAERPARLESDTVSGYANCYPETYPGRVISIRPVGDVESGKLPSLRNMSDRDHLVAVLDLDDEQRNALASRTRKMVDGRAVPVTFNDRFGAVAVTLRENHTDPEQWEADEIARIEKAESDNETATREYDTALEEYRALKETFPREVIDANRLDGEAPPFPEAPPPLRLVDVGESSFDREASALAKSLAPTVTRTGTGLYAVKVTPTKLDRTQSGPDSGQTITFTVGGLGTADAYKGGYITNVTQSETRAIVSHIDDAAVLEGDVTAWADTDDLDIFDAWSTIQAAHDQLVTDQGAAAFTSTQTIDVFDGTYTEDIVFNNILIPTEVWRLELKAATGETSVILTNLGLSGHVILTNTVDSCYIAGMTVHSTISGQYGIRVSGLKVEVHNVTVVGSNNGGGVFFAAVAGCWLRDTDVSASLCVLVSGVGVIIERCSLDVVPGGTGVWLTGQNLEMSGCTIAGATNGIRLVQNTNTNPAGTFTLWNNTFYDCTRAINDTNDADETVLSLRGGNNIFTTTTGSDFAINEPGILGVMSFESNTYNGYTSPFHLGGSDLSLAQWQAETDRDGNSPDANSFEADPLLTDPGSGDFSLQAASPARNAGHGSGVVTGINDVDFDPNVPDIGAWSSGPFVLDPPVISSITPNFDGDSFDMTVGQTLGRTVLVYTSPEIPSAFALDAATRDGDGDLTVTSKTSGLVYYVYCQTLIGNTVAGTSNVVKVLITDTDTGGIPAAVDEDPSALPGVDILLRDDSHDMAVAESDLILVQGSALVKQRLAIILQLFKGEWFLDADAGIPYFQEILEKGVDATVVDAILRSAIIATDGVNRILTYESSIDSAARTITVAFTVDTVYGPVVFEGAIL